MSFEKHSRPNASKLDRYQSEIVEMRAQEWPYPKVRSYLETEHGVTVSAEAIRKFCLSRKIEKGGGVSNSLPKAKSKKRLSSSKRENSGKPKKTETPDYGNMSDDEIYESLIADNKPKPKPQVFTKTF